MSTEMTSVQIDAILKDLEQIVTLIENMKDNHNNLMKLSDESFQKNMNDEQIAKHKALIARADALGM